MLQEALAFPFRGDRGDALETLAIGGGLHLLAAFVPLLPLVPVVGYLVGLLRADGGGVGGNRADGGGDDAADPSGGVSDDGEAVAEGGPHGHGVELPLFRGPRRLLRDGLFGSLVCLAYLVPPVAFLLLTVGRAAIEGVPADVPSRLFVVASTLSLLLAATFAYVLPAALVGLARSGLRAAFDPRGLWGTVTDGRYFYAWSVGAVTIGSAVALAQPLNRIALGFFVLFYAEVVAARAIADGVRGNGFTSAR
ncbi:DUF4013 domain-containing protein [Halorarum halobium]|uniref:DUF4013 domain-containing protein n=1 Tax=Halorarum halobium TaxID=3075121 RepID=UPI0028A80894|nr:DUF4013 domain-containing protein [Halobaculum sp. XH14]